MGQYVMHGLNALVVVFVHNVLAAGVAGCLFPCFLGQKVQGVVQYVQQPDLKARTACFHIRLKDRVRQGGHDRPTVIGNMPQNPPELDLGTDQVPVP